MNSQCSRRYFITVQESEATLKSRNISHDDVMKWKHFPRYRVPTLCEGIHRSPVDSPHKDQWRGILMFSFICAWTHGWANNQDVGDLKRRRAHYCITVMWIQMVIHPHRNTCSLHDFGPILKISSKSVNTSWLWPEDTILCHRTWSALVQVMASSLMAPSHYLKQYWHILVFIPWQCLLEYSVYQYTSFMKFTRLKFVNGSLYMSGAQCIDLDRVCSMFADALVTDAVRAPVDVRLPVCILQTLSFHWCRFLSYPCTVCMSRNVRKFSLPCVTSVTWTNLSLYLIITWRVNRQHDALTDPVNARSSILCCVLSHRYRYRSFNQYCSGLLHRHWGKYIVAPNRHN